MSHNNVHQIDFSLVSDRVVAAELCRRLKLARLNANLTQAELASRAGLSLRTVIRAESGETGTTILTLIALLRALGKLDSLETFLPVPPPSPLMARANAVSEREPPYRRRASKQRKRGDAVEGGWKWGDET